MRNAFLTHNVAVSYNRVIQARLGPDLGSDEPIYLANRFYHSAWVPLVFLLDRGTVVSAQMPSYSAFWDTMQDSNCQSVLSPDLEIHVEPGWNKKTWSAQNDVHHVVGWTVKKASSR